MITGGGNGAVSTWKLDTLNEPEELNCDLRPGDFPKLVHIMEDSILVLTNDGFLISVIKGKMEWIQAFPVLKTYAVMDTNSQDTILIGSLSGSIQIFQLNPEYKSLLEVTIIEGKIYSATLFLDRFLVNGAEGRLILAGFTPEGTWSKLAEGSIPDSKLKVY